MLFETPEERDQFFDGLVSGQTKVRFGMALEHALTTNLGIWGKREELLEDVAHVMAYEVALVAGSHHPTRRMDEYAIHRSGHFCEAFGYARSLADGKLAGELRQAGASYAADTFEQAESSTSAQLAGLFSTMRQIVDGGLPVEALEQSGQFFARLVLQDVRSAPRHALRDEFAHG